MTETKYAAFPSNTQSTGALSSHTISSHFILLSCYAWIYSHRQVGTYRKGVKFNFKRFQQVCIPEKESHTDKRIEILWSFYNIFCLLGRSVLYISQRKKSEENGTLQQVQQKQQRRRVCQVRGTQKNYSNETVSVNLINSNNIQPIVHSPSPPPVSKVGLNFLDKQAFLSQFVQKHLRKTTFVCIEYLH